MFCVFISWNKFNKNLAKIYLPYIFVLWITELKFSVYKFNFDFKFYFHEIKTNHCACPVQKDIRLMLEQYFSNPHNMWSNGDNIKNLLSAQIVIVTISVHECSEGGFRLVIKIIKSNWIGKCNTIWVHMSLSNKFLLIRVTSKILQD